MPEHLQPGVNVRTFYGNRLSDEEVITYYSGLAKKYGALKGRYKNAICFVYDENHIFECMDDSLSGEPFLIVGKPHKKRVEGFPLDSLSVHPSMVKYYYDMSHMRVDDIVMKHAFHAFFHSAFQKLDEVSCFFN